MNILVAIEFCEHTDRVLASARNLAKQMNAQVHLIHVAEPDPDFVGYEAGPEVVRQQVAHEFHQEHQDLQSFADQFRADGIDTKALLVQGPIVDTLLKLSEKLTIDLIITGSHGRSMVGNLLMGSVSSGLVKRATCPVTVITPNIK